MQGEGPQHTRACVDICMFPLTVCVQCSPSFGQEPVCSTYHVSHEAHVQRLSWVIPRPVPTTCPDQSPTCCVPYHDSQEQSRSQSSLLGMSSRIFAPQIGLSLKMQVSFSIFYFSQISSLRRPCLSLDFIYLSNNSCSFI